MSRSAKAVLLFVLIAAIVACVHILALGQEAAWASTLPAAAAKTTFRVLTIALGLGAWFTSQSLIAARGMRATSSWRSVTTIIP